MVSGLNQSFMVHLAVRVLLMHVVEHRVDDDAHAVRVRVLHQRLELVEVPKRGCTSRPAIGQ